MNIAEFLLRNGDDDSIAIHFVREDIVGIERVTWRDLRDRVRLIRGAMLNSDIRTGDVVAAVISNSTSAIAIALATLSIGAIWSSSSCDIGVEAILARYQQIEPKIVFVDDGYVYGGKLRNLGDRIAVWSNRLGKAVKLLANTVIIPNCGLNVDPSKVFNGCTFDSFLSRHNDLPLDFAMLPFSHPAFILFSSGTVSGSHSSCYFIHSEVNYRSRQELPNALCTLQA
jgi:acetoacetyl-CoA synthetase